MRKQHYITATLLLLLTAFWSCTTSEQAVERDTETQRETGETSTETVTNETLERLNQTRNRLSDVYLTQQHDIPEAYLQRDTTHNSYNNPFDGFRIQLLSTRDVNMADSVSTQFRLWADSTFADYTPKAYVFFKQPYYKVHIGDFQDRQKANTLSRIIKQKYPDAWVVHDRIDPESVPADTTRIGITTDSLRTQKKILNQQGNNNQART